MRNSLAGRGALMAVVAMAAGMASSSPVGTFSGRSNAGTQIPFSQQRDRSKAQWKTEQRFQKKGKK